ncbi:MAG: transcription elongation factor GreA, partial [Bdellovibrionales bacterium]|nr:transcription elongation factor GreA [Bdellovibrionales bacterium]
YDAAKEKSGMVEAKIRDLDTKLSMAEVIDPRNLPEPTKVVFGVTVSIEDLDSGESKKLTIVGADESNAHNGWISIESPLGKSLIGKEEGDVVKVKLPGGAREYEVMALALEYEDQGESDDE